MLSFPERAIVGALRAPYGDFRNWDEIRNWAEEIAESLSEADARTRRS
jgi:menaquinone-dependent protoporphyrinogen oxidase